MGELAVVVDSLGKRYRIGQKNRIRYRTLRDQITKFFTAPFRHRKAGNECDAFVITKQDEYIWALRDINFEIKSGEVVGVIGPNGAGKSTLLKILTRITEPTEGVIDIYGRVGSLLEVGTGFHKELTGRENVYLNGAILGMYKTEIDRKFDEIVAFSGVEKFIDTPVKFYSTGMSVRLAFAVAAHLEPEILLVDEVLAVGDTAFQRKCINKMEDIGKEGRTVIFVSHQMQAITRLCERVILLDEGHIRMDGHTREVVGEYVSGCLNSTCSRQWNNLSEAPGNDIVRLRSVRVKTKDGPVTGIVDMVQTIGFEMVFEVLKPGHIFYPYFIVYNEEGVRLFSSIDTDPIWHRRPRAVGCYVSTGWLPSNILNEGTILIGPAITTDEPARLYFYERDTISLQIVENLKGNNGSNISRSLRGAVRPALEWTTQFTPKGVV